jgi:hypothetical protein
VVVKQWILDSALMGGQLLVFFMEIKMMISKVSLEPGIKDGGGAHQLDPQMTKESQSTELPLLTVP